MFIPGAFQIISSVVKDEPRIEEALRTGQGFARHEHEAGLFEGTERFFRPAYAVHLFNTWIPSLEGMPASDRDAIAPPTGNRVESPHADRDGHS